MQLSPRATYSGLLCSPPLHPAGWCIGIRNRVVCASSSGEGVRGSFRSNNNQASNSYNNETVDWGSSAFPSYLVSLTGRPFPCQEGLDPSTTRPGTGIKAKWKREDAIWQRIRCGLCGQLGRGRHCHKGWAMSVGLRANPSAEQGLTWHCILQDCWVLVLHHSIAHFTLTYISIHTHCSTHNYTWTCTHVF